MGGDIEAWGRGIQKIRESCKENGNKMAEYQVHSSESMVVFCGLRNTQENAQDNIQENTQDDILFFEGGLG